MGDALFIVTTISIKMGVKTTTSETFDDHNPALSKYYKVLSEIVDTNDDLNGVFLMSTEGPGMLLRSEVIDRRVPEEEEEVADDDEE